MVMGPIEGMQADVIFVIEGTAVNGAYLNDLKIGYVVPTLEYFNQGVIEDREYVSENTTTLYGIVVYHAADCLPAPCTETFGPYSNPHKLLMMLDKLEMIGGKGESYANIGEGLATGLQCFEDLQLRREPNTASQKHCILICNSPPYQIMIQETYKFAGHTIEQLAAIYQERNINISILSPRKIPALFKLFEKAGGDLQSSQTKNYAKDPRHLVLLRNYNLKERPVSPVMGGNVHNVAATAAQIPLSPLQSNDSPNTNQVQQNIAPPSQAQGPPFRNQAPQNITSVHQAVTPAMAVPMNAARPPYNPQIAAPPNYHPTALGPRTTHATRWMRPFVAPGTTAPANTQNSSALIAQLTQPPSLGLNVGATFGQRLDGSNNVMAPNPQQQQQLTQQQQLRLTMQLQQQNAQQQAVMSMAAQSTHNQPGSQLTVSSMSQSVPTQVPQTVAVSQAPISASSVTQQIAPPQAQGNVATGTVQGQQLNVQRERQNIWQGVLEWLEKAKNPADTQKQTRHVPCHVSANFKNGEPELKADTWPPKLIMQLMPKQLIGNIGGSYIKNSKSVIFHPTPCEALESLTKVMTAGFAGCVHFTSASSSSACEIKVLILLYTADKKSYLGFIPNDQTAFVERLRKVIQQQKSSHASMRQAQGNPGPGNTIPAPMPTTGAQGGILMSQTNTTAMGGAQITQSVVSSSAPQMNMQNSGISGPQANVSAGGIITQQRPQFDDLEIARHQNLLKIQRLRQTLEAAQQQEAQYKSQLEVNIQQNLEVAQQQEMQYKQQLEAQQAQRGINPAAMSNQQANAQRMMRPISTNSIGLRHLLQQSQPQYRQVFGVQQQIQVGPRGQIAARPMAPANTQNQQFEDVPNYDFLNCQ
ncbi:mediator of RNA polymerase II transcription subunit 25-like [Odontomachus brunneus]|uniref:mediator of RNA polymerase II transcription subunit 25-like n=1 Tax=Odontomachus brunneus TaxID=486640 RepID=UPI0013F2B100|nr:mediator of RNA polymerase II transcription subunit 25-like [Odontomachus brunneus]XP_032691033.1 mediator of RNA polymerase II transcription subunit 25-like [Odontomachus brunneus]